jgi:hypothetical protein
MGIRTEILSNLAARLATVTAANGYTTDVKKVYFDKIPMGLELNDYEMPAIYLLDQVDQLNTQLAIVEGQWNLQLQLWNSEASDTDMLQFIGDVFKSIYANSPVAQTNGAFRSIHANIVEIKPLSISGDLHMIEANRVSILIFELRYRTKLFDL